MGAIGVIPNPWDRGDRTLVRPDHGNRGAERMQHRSFLLEVTPQAFRPKPFTEGKVGLVQATVRETLRCRALWLGVGRGFWTARTRWAMPRWQLHLRDPGVAFWLASLGAEDIGFFELTVRRRGIKIEGFGLLPAWRGQGLGAGLLTAATGQAFQSGAARVWLHTATDDHPNALPNYQARGYRVYKERELTNPVPNARPPVPFETCADAGAPDGNSPRRQQERIGGR